MSKKYYRIVIDDLYMTDDGETMADYSVVDTRSGKVVLQTTRIVEIDISEQAKQEILEEVYDMMSKIKDNKLN